MMQKIGSDLHPLTSNLGRFIKALEQNDEFKQFASASKRVIDDLKKQSKIISDILKRMAKL